MDEAELKALLEQVKAARPDVNPAEAPLAAAIIYLADAFLAALVLVAADA